MMSDNRCAYRGPVEEPLGVGDGEIDAPVAHRVSEVVMPVCSVDCITPDKEHRPWDVGEIIVIDPACAPAHRESAVLGIDGIPTYRCRMYGYAGRYEDGL